MDGIDVREMIQREIGSALRSIKDEFGATTDFIAAEQADLRSDIVKCTEAIKHLESENLKLQTELNRLNVRMTGIDKISRNCNI